MPRPLIFRLGQSRQLRHAVGPGDVQLAVVHRRPDQHRLVRLVRFLQAGRQARRSTTAVTGYNPNGLNIITSGVSISRPPRANIYFGYSIIDTGPIKTSAINVSISYWLSPKWYGTFSESYDFGDAVSLGTMFAFTRIGADYLTTIGLTVDPQRKSLHVRLSDHSALESGPAARARPRARVVRYAVCSDPVT